MTKPTTVALTGSDAFRITRSAEPDTFEVTINDHVVLVGGVEALIAAGWNVAALAGGVRVTGLCLPVLHHTDDQQEDSDGS